jgi:hypothetical protein
LTFTLGCETIAAGGVMNEIQVCAYGLALLAVVQFVLLWVTR